MDAVQHAYFGRVPAVIHLTELRWRAFRACGTLPSLIDFSISMSCCFATPIQCGVDALTAMTT